MKEYSAPSCRRRWTAGLGAGVLLCAGLFLAPATRATTVNVASLAALQSAVDSAAPGDVLVLANGTYTNTTLTIDTSDITVTAMTPGGVFLNGTQSVYISGDRVTFSGFQFTSGDIGTGFLIEVAGSYNRLTQLNLNGYRAQKYIRIQGGTVSNEVSYCNIENKPTNAVINCTIQITTSTNIPGYHRISHCSFKNFPGLGGDYGNEPIRIGLSTEATNVSRTVVEYCYFTNTGLGDSESISVKSCENICRYNTFSGNVGGMLVFRHGFRNVAYGNFFLNNSGGVRIKEGNTHYVYNNYFDTGAEDALTLQYVVESPLTNINFAHNTFNNPGPIDLGGAGIGGVYFANNLFKKSSGSLFSNPNDSSRWVSNIYQGTLGITKPSSGLANVDPKLVLNTDGYYGIASNSPAINAAGTNYPAMLGVPGVDDDPNILFDISGQPRPAALNLKDVGCDEFTNGVTSNRPLTLADVGPVYLGGPALPAPVISTQPQGQAVLVGTPVSLSVTATGTPPLSFQWRKNGVNLPGATATNFNLAAAQLTNSGVYTVVVTNFSGSVTSSIATLTVSDGTTEMILDDRWLDGTRTNTALPTDAAWFANNSATLVAQTNSLSASPDPASTMTWWTYFTANAAAPIVLDVSTTLRLALVFKPAGVNATNPGRGVRLGLYDSSGGTRTLADGSNPNGTNVSGYMLNFNFGQMFAGSPTMQFMERTNLPSSNLIGTVNDYASLSTGGPLAGSPGFSNGVEYELELLLRRNTNSLDLTGTISDTNGWSLSLSATVTNSFTSRFDTFVFRPALQSQTATNFSFTQLKVEKLSSQLAVPPEILTQPTNQTVSAGAPAAFFVTAMGTDPISCQWRKDGINLAGATATNFSLAAAQSTNAGAYTVVLTNAVGSITSAVATLTVLVDAPQFSQLSFAPGAGLGMVGTGPTGEVYRVIATTNLTLPLSGWTAISTGTFSGGTFNYTDAAATNLPSRFYRAVTP